MDPIDLAHCYDQARGETADESIERLKANCQQTEPPVSPARALDLELEHMLRELRTLGAKRDAPCGVHTKPQWTCAFCLHNVLERVEAEHIRAILHFTMKGYTAGENTDAKHWRKRAEEAEAELGRLRAPSRATPEEEAVCVHDLLRLQHRGR